MTDDEAKERAEDARVIARAHHGIDNGYMALNARARERWPQAIADREKAEARLAEAIALLRRHVGPGLPISEVRAFLARVDP